jgi:hypothetical protein
MRTLLILFVLLITVTVAYAVDGQAFLGMFAETSVMQIAGMPEMPPIPPGIEMPNMPGMEGMMSMGKPVRSFTVRLWSPGIAPEGATASIVPPDGLKQGNKLDLELYRPKAEKSETGGEQGQGDKGKTPDFTIKYYWGSSATVKPGQPKIISFKTMTAEARQLMEKERPAARGGSSYFYKPDWTTAYWPTKKQPGKIAKDAALGGKYSLTTSYTGGVELDCPPNVDFLAPIKIVNPNLEDPIDLTGAVTLKWEPIPNLLGSHAVITGIQGQDTIIMWSSAEIWRDDIMSVDWGYLQMAEVQQYVKDKIMMPGAQTQCIVPTGIFQDCDVASLTMTGYGPGAARMDTQPLPRIQTKTKLTIQLGGKAVGEMK